MVELNDQICKSSSNFKSIEWKLPILEIWHMVTFWPKLTSKIIGGWIHWAGMQTLFKFLVNLMKIEDFRNVTKLVTIGLCWPFDLKNNRLLAYNELDQVVKFREDRFKIVTCRRMTGDFENVLFVAHVIAKLLSNTVRMNCSSRNIPNLQTLSWSLRKEKKEVKV